VVERCLWVTRAPCVAGFGVRKVMVRSHGGAREMRPRALCVSGEGRAAVSQQARVQALVGA
jgi:hypothetical protein